MNQRISFITIGVENLDKIRAFYCNVFGWIPIKDSDGILFYKMNGFILAFFPVTELAEEVCTDVGSHGFKRFSLSMNYGSELEVDRVFSSLEENGAEVIRKPEKVFWGGYRGYIADMEGNFWELAYNPFLEMDGDGNSMAHR